MHRELKFKHRNLHFNDKFPLLPTHPFFKRYLLFSSFYFQCENQYIIRFNEDIIKERKAAILIFLEYIAKLPKLFTSDVFVKFFEVSINQS